jgi:hypothetical protein
MDSRIWKRGSILVLATAASALMGAKCPFGLSLQAYEELHDAGVDRYVGDFTPATSEPAGEWVKHTFDTDGTDGPICIDGSPLTVFTRLRNPFKLVIFLDGGGACWQGFYFCDFTANANPPGPGGIFADSYDAGGGSTIENPLADWSMMFVSYCDGSVFSGDNELADASFPVSPTRYHRGVRNVTAAIDLAKAEFPLAHRVLLAGSSAGGYGVTGPAPAIVRFVFGNLIRFFIFNDSGPAVSNLDQPGTIATRVNDWAYTQFVPASCTDCTTDKQPAELVEWLLENDSTVREALYSTDGDAVIRFFLGFLSQVEYRDLLLTTHDPIHAAFPRRYNRFIRSGSSQHTSLVGNLFYTAEIDGVPLYQWTDDFVHRDPGWIDLVEDFIPLP